MLSTLLSSAVVCFLLLLSSSCSSSVQVVADEQPEAKTNEHCNILSFFRFDFSDHGYDDEEDSSVSTAFSYMAAAELAKHHFNTRDTSVVQELADETYENCNIQLSTIHRDEQHALESVLEFTTENKEICAVLGPPIGNHDDLRTIQILSGITQLQHIPLLINEPISPRIQYDSVVATRYPLRYLARAVADLCHSYLQPARDYVIVFYDNEDFDGPFQERLEDELDREASGEWLVGEDDAIEDAIGEVMDEGYNTIVVDTNDFSLLPKVAEEADKEGVLDRPILWMIASKVFEGGKVLETLELDIGSPLDRLLTGAAMYADYDPFLMTTTATTTNDNEDKFLASWKQQNSTLIKQQQLLEQVNTAQQSQINKDEALFASAPKNHDNNIADAADFLQTTNPATHASFVYDSVVLTGMAACRRQQQLQLQQQGTGYTNNNTTIESSLLPPPILLEEMMLQTSFVGASGPFEFGEPPPPQEKDDEDSGGSESTSTSSSGSSSTEEEAEPQEEDSKNAKKKKKKINRSPVGAQYGYYNIRSKPSDTDAGKHRYYTVLTAIHKDGQWTAIEGEEHQFVYSDGTTNPLVPVRISFEDNYLDATVSRVGLGLMALALIISIGSALWICYQEKHQCTKLILASQPEFLYLMCLGSTLVASTIAFVSFDESIAKFSIQKLSAFCQAAPWFFVVGYIIIYCALVGKLWRIDKIASNSLRRQQKILVKHALWPFGFLGACIVVLICWQILDPFVWERIILNDEPLETLGKCTSNNVTPYVTTLGILIFWATLLTLHMSWKTKDVQDTLAETKWIFAGIFSHLQMWAVGIPTFIILNNQNGTSAYLIKVALCFLFSTVMIVLVIWPKIWIVHFKNNETTTTRTIPRISISNIDRSSTVRVSGIGRPSTSGSGSLPVFNLPHQSGNMPSGDQGGGYVSS